MIDSDGIDLYLLDIEDSSFGLESEVRYYYVERLVRIYSIKIDF